MTIPSSTMLLPPLSFSLDAGMHEHDVYNIASGTAPSLGEIVSIVRQIVPGCDISIGPGSYEFVPGLPAVRKRALDISRAASESGYRPGFVIRRGLDEYIRAQSAQASIPS